MSSISEIEIAVFILLIVVAVGMASVRAAVSVIERRINVLTRVDAKLDLLLKHAGIEFDPYKNVPGDVVDAIRRGEKIEAIKRYRDATGTGLKEAKDFIEEVQRRLS